MNRRFAGSIVTLLVSFALVTAVGCGGGDDDDTVQPADITGTWIVAFSSGTTGAILTVTQTDGVVTGTITIDGIGVITITGTVTDRIVDLTMQPLGMLQITSLMGTVADNDQSMAGTGKQPLDGSFWTGSWSAARQ